MGGEGEKGELRQSPSAPLESRAMVHLAYLTKRKGKKEAKIPTSAGWVSILSFFFFGFPFPLIPSL